MPNTGLGTDTIKIDPDKNDRCGYHFTQVIAYETTPRVGNLPN